ncbi:hypothetical protein BDZ91DRAFT_795770 [Kalaharituber pfeilii]|nr:hypothetical protein BDZ91DRAFT_795770 [Kalaharituber pfeilii]
MSWDTPTDNDAWSMGPSTTAHAPEADAWDEFAQGTTASGEGQQFDATTSFDFGGGDQQFGYGGGEAGPKQGGGFRGTCRICDQEGHRAAECPSKPSRACRICQQEGHFAAECPDKAPRTCRVCQAEDHMAAECPNKAPRTCRICEAEDHLAAECPKKAPRACRVCQQEGHLAAECPNKKPIICRNCNEEGHSASNCTKPRVLFQQRAEGEELPDPEDVWQKMIQADAEEDLEEFKKLLLLYAEAIPTATFPDLEAAFRGANMKIHLIALETEILGNRTLVNLQGQPDQQYVLKLQLGPRPKRAMLVSSAMATTPEENMQRLEKTGLVMDSYKPWCLRCKENGHISKNCPVEKPENVERKDQNSVRERPLIANLEEVNQWIEAVRF